MNVSDGPLPEPVQRNFWSLYRGAEREEGGNRKEQGGDDCKFKHCSFSVFRTSQVNACPLNLSTLFTNLSPSLSLTWSETESPLFSHGRSPDIFPPPSSHPHLHHHHISTLHPTHTHTHTHSIHNKTSQLLVPV